MPVTPLVRLDWDGKRPPACRPEPAPELIPPVGCVEDPNLLICGDNLQAMWALAPRYAGKVALIYMDPPFFTRKDWYMQRTAGQPASARAYEDTWNNDLGSYLQWLIDRLAAARVLLADTGSIYLHLNYQAAHYARLIMDELFGIENFQNEIIWCYREAINSRLRWNRKHDTILFYSKGAAFTFNPDTVLQPYSESTLKKFRRTDENGPYRLMGRGLVDSPLRSKRDISPEMEALHPDLTYRHYLGQGTLPVDYWIIDIENQASARRTGYPTQKPEKLLERIVMASSNPGDLVADFCCGSGTTLAAAQKLGRQWIGCDSGELAISTASERLLASDAAFITVRTPV